VLSAGFQAEFLHAAAETPFGEAVILAKTSRAWFILVIVVVGRRVRTCRSPDTVTVSAA
jgi:hypothetical protein